jgi:hypothetical protein
MGGGLALACSIASRVQAEPKQNTTQLAQELVQEALQREVYGLAVERERLLTEAVTKAPQLAAAQWARGLVLDGRRGWVPADTFGTQNGLLERLAKYEAQREKTGDSVASQLSLANWCRKLNLADQEKAHLYRILDQDSDHQEARARLGFVRMLNGWKSTTDLNEQQTREEQRRANIEKWLSHITEIRRALEHRSRDRQARAAAELLGIRDVSVVPAIEQVFLPAAPALTGAALEALSQIPDPEASLTLARFAVMASSEEVRADASRRLAKRDLNHFVPQMLAAMYTPTQSQFLLVRSPDGRLVERHAFVREGQEQKDVMVLDTSFVRVTVPGGDGRESTQRAVFAAGSEIAQREAQLRLQNAWTMEANRRMTAALNVATQQQLAVDPSAWWKWWNDRNEVQAEGAKPVNGLYNQRQVSIVDQSVLPTGPTGSNGMQSAAPRAMHECLAAGTPVWTIRGARAIETVQAGDLVLSQHPDTGELAYKPVLRATRRPKSELKTIQVAGETWNTTGGHQFWVAGRGWAKSSELRSGDVLHTVRGPLRVSSVEKGPALETFNLVVDDFHTYFVGAAEALTHDYTAAGPTRAVVPGLIER